jgi:hypothetical protein
MARYLVARAWVRQHAKSILLIIAIFLPMLRFSHVGVATVKSLNSVR